MLQFRKFWSRFAVAAWIGVGVLALTLAIALPLALLERSSQRKLKLLKTQIILINTDNPNSAVMADVRES